MAADLTILYRGPLSSCNYACEYCPFAKHHETAAELATDRRALERFTDWVLNDAVGKLAIFFTPWGEALTRRWYHDAFRRLSHADHIQRVVAQTNLSGPLDWLRDTRTDRVALWCTYHPSETSRTGFLTRCKQLQDFGIQHSVGMVGRPQDFDEITVMRAELPPETYLWINAYDSGDGTKFPYSPTERNRLTEIDPYFPTNIVDHPSLGRDCRTGRSVISVDGDGTIRRCHFVRTPIGNIYDPDWQSALTSRPCPNNTCGCHIGYVHMPELGQEAIYGDEILARIPQTRVLEDSTAIPNR
ncbi:STM4011 family radical SAM protein [Thalassoroseus pseudoceratinae]|uniref:STM4011 family radical SAM protein n=1 Tax=Thalassoroseus pseudoceratinae TaxID=2713176 RepID=UPI0014229295|nr:STM4011 family radical SAM protein [Thalassoroseus pseudoceratinae]